MPRVTQAEVLEIIEVDDEITELTPFITAANLMVTQAFSGNTQIGEALLKEIERYLAAHFITLRDPRVTSESNEGISVSYAGSFGEGLKSSSYGQMALTLDFTGSLAKLGRKKASFSMVNYATS